MMICMFVYNNCKNDSRVLKEAKTLAGAGHDVRIIALLDEETEPYEERDGFRIIRVPKDPLHYTIFRALRGLRQMILAIDLRSISWPTVVKNAFFLKMLPVSKTTGLVSERRSTGVRRNLVVRFWCQLHYLGNRLRGVVYQIFNKWGQRSRFANISVFGALPLVTLYPARKLTGILSILAHFTSAMGTWIERWLKRFGCIVRDGARRFPRKAKRLGSVVLMIIYNMVRAILMPAHRPLCYLDFYWRAFKLVRKDPADVYHAHDLNTLPLAYLATRFFGGELVYDSHELYTERNTPKKQSRLLRYLLSRLESWLSGSTRYTITVNESIARELKRRYALNNVVVVMNCPPRSSKRHKMNLREELRIEVALKLVIYIGGITFNRGLEELIMASDFLPEAAIVFLGYGNQRYLERLKELAADSPNRRERIYFLGPVPPEEVVGYACSAHVGVAPIKNSCLSYYFCSPNKLFEYLAAGLPVVGSNFPELKKVIEGYRLGKTFDPDDPKDIARAINYVLSDERRYGEMKRNAVKASEKFNWENESKKLLRIYKELAFGTSTGTEGVVG